MNPGNQFLKNFLGEGFFEDLKKSNELFKLGTQTALNPEELLIGLKIVPRTVMSFLISELVPMAVGDQKVIQLPFGVNASMNVNKGDTDSYSGNVISAGKPVYDYRNRSIPGIGIILLSTFELYDLKELEKDHQHEPAHEENIQKLIDERLEQRALLDRVIDQKISEREAIHKILMQKITSSYVSRAERVTEVAPSSPNPPAPMQIDVQPKDIIKKESAPKKGSPLKEFMARKKPKEFAINMEKSETVNCPDCGQTIFGDGGYSGCVCMGSDQNGKIWLKKTEDGVKIRFSKGWDPENMEMLLQVLMRKDG